MDKEQIIKDFTNTLIIRNLSFNTIENYLWHLNEFLSWCQTKQIVPKELDSSGVKEYVAFNKPGYSTIKQRRGLITNLFTYCFSNPTILYGLPFPKHHDHLPDYLTVPELKLLFDSVTNIKQRCILKLQYSCALRVHEVVKIKRKDFIRTYDSYNKEWVFDLRVIGKGNSEYLIPVPNETITEIFEYWKSVPKTIRKTEYLFPGQFRSCYSERSVQVVMNRALIKLGLKKYGKSTHLLRSSRATHLVQSGVDIFHIKDLLRHKNLKTVQRYVRLTTQSMRVIFRKADAEIFESIREPQKLITKIKSA